MLLNTQCLPVKINYCAHYTFVYPKLIFVLLALYIGNAGTFAQGTGKTIVRGTVTDSITGETLPYVAIMISGRVQGTNSDNNGKFVLVISDTVTRIFVSYIGYLTQEVRVRPGQVNRLDIKMRTDVQALKEVVIKPGKYRYKNRNNPAVELIEDVIRNRKVNQGGNFQTLSYEKYEKKKFALSNINEAFKQRKIFNHFQFIFSNTDSTRIDFKEILPIYIQESLSDCYFKKPDEHKEVVKASKMISIDEYVDEKGVSEYLKYFYQNINIYDENIIFVSNQFLSPIAVTAPVFYKYFILDTSLVNQARVIHMAFVPRNKTDMLFQGELYILPDSNYAVKRVDMTVNKQINLNWVKSVRIRQDFENLQDKGYVLQNDELDLDFGVTKNSLGIYGERLVSYTHFKVNEPQDDSLYRGHEDITLEGAGNRPDKYWQTSRPLPLTKSEQGIYTMVDSIKQIPTFKRDMSLMVLIFTSYFDTRYFEIGPYSAFASYNPIEGFRGRFGGNTTPAFSKKITFNGYLAYGFRDEKFKHLFETYWSLTPHTIHDFPVKYIRIRSQNEIRIPGENLENIQPDNILLSFKRGVNDKMYYKRTYSIEHLNEFPSHFSYTLGYQYSTITPAGNLIFNSSDYLSHINNPSHINISEPYLVLRYAPHEQFYQGKIYRTSIANGYPVFQVQANFGMKLLHGDYTYQNLKFTVSKRFWFSVLGYTDLSVEADKIFGKVPYPLLNIHRANQTYSYDNASYNLMNFLEFVSDEYTAVNLDHCFNGFFFNKVPLFKKLKLREVVSLKALFGNLSSLNNPSDQPDLLKLPVDAQSVPITYSLDKRPYVEGSIGVSNILRYFRVDVVHRFTYLNNPGVSQWGLRIKGKFDF